MTATQHELAANGAASSASQQLHNTGTGASAAITALCALLACGTCFGQTTRTSPSATSTSPTITQSAPTSATTPCYSSSRTSPCYATTAPRIRCYSAANPDEPCSTVTTPDTPPVTKPAALPAPSKQATGPALTEDQAKAQIEAAGYLKVGRLRKDGGGAWHGRAEKDGLSQSVTLDARGSVSAN